MGSPLVDDVNWICDKCGVKIPKEELRRPDPNKYEAYHKKCFTPEVQEN